MSYHEDGQMSNAKIGHARTSGDKDDKNDKTASSRGVATRTRLILAAEALFAEHGIDAVALRSVGEAAGQRNNSSVQYHFADKAGLLQAIFDHREAQLQPLRRALLERAMREGRQADVKSLLRIIFEPNWRLYVRDGGIAYLKLTSLYLTQYRPRGVPHPIDRDSEQAAAFREAIRLLAGRLAYLGRRRFNLRLESVGAMFLSAAIQHAGRPPAERDPPEALFEDVLEMMAAAICAPPWQVPTGPESRGRNHKEGVAPTAAKG